MKKKSVWARFVDKYGAVDADETTIDDTAARDTVVELGFKIANNLPISGGDIQKLPTKEYGRYYKIGMNRLGMAPSSVKTDLRDKDDTWKYPSSELFELDSKKAKPGDTKKMTKQILDVLAEHGYEAEPRGVDFGPRVAEYHLRLPAKKLVKLKKFMELETVLTQALGRGTIMIGITDRANGIVAVEVPHKVPVVLRLGEMIASEEYQESSSPLTVPLGRDASGNICLVDLHKLPHLLISGCTGSGKSVMLDALVTSLIYRNSPREVQLILIDPKRIQFHPYKDIPHLRAPIIVDIKETISALKFAVALMEQRYHILADRGMRNIDDYNGVVTDDDKMAYIVLVIDELADIMVTAGDEAETYIIRLCQMARAVGIHLVLATSRPSRQIIRDLMKANIPARMAFSVISKSDSLTILDQAGAERLLGKGDMLFQGPGEFGATRIQGAMVEDNEIAAITEYLREQQKPNYDAQVTTMPVFHEAVIKDTDPEPDDPLIEKAEKLVIESDSASAVLIQKKLKIGYARAALLVDALEERGLVGPADGAKPREVLVKEYHER